MQQTDATPLQHSPLYDWHVAHGAKMADFGGWEMPIEYPGGGVLKEHAAVREQVGIFDVSHLGKGVVRGPGAAAYVNSCLTNDLGKLVPGQAQYTLCCQQDGGVVDDLIAYLRGEDEVFLIPNASNTSEVLRLLGATAPEGVEVVNLHRSLAVIAVQGPHAAGLLTRLGLPVAHDYMSFVTAQWQGRQVIVCRSGYTGEVGFELLPQWEDATPLWEALLEAGADLGVLPAGLGARDTLRTEMGYPLHGNDLSPDITPVQARVGWAVGWSKPAFWGRDALIRERAEGAVRLLWGIESIDRGIPRPHMPVLTADGDRVGEVTSGTFSPTRRVGIGLALLDRSVKEDDELLVDVRGRTSVVRVVKPPFVKTSTR
ncbi:MAG: aminomethyltransferase [Frankiales bacterium]|jgi:aminomethyltransferase|nr:aminomethyltransferase [Frankiales bacterium]MDX6246377.1 aminomethyltransferase [Frankiales bacterium]